MSIACSRLISGDSIPCEPYGVLKQYGWLPGTFVKFVYANRTFTKTLASCDVCGVTDFPCGFITVGSDVLKNGFDDSYPNDNEYNGVWTFDRTTELVTKYHNIDLEFDNQKQLSKMGAGILMVNLGGTGACKFYVYEKYDKDYRTSAGVSGSVFDWTTIVGKHDSLYVSSRGLLTMEKENVNSVPMEFIAVDVGNDENGKYVAIASR